MPSFPYVCLIIPQRPESQGTAAEAEGFYQRSRGTLIQKRDFHQKDERFVRLIAWTPLLLRMPFLLGFQGFVLTTTPVAS